MIIKQSGLGKRIESMCRKALYEFKMLEECPKLGIALSGGKDSLTLLFMLKRVLGRGLPLPELYAIHVSGDFTCGPSQNYEFLKKTCDALGVPLIARESKQKLETLSCYPCSRERRRLIFEAAKEVGVGTVAFGHHRDDSIETLLMNLLHKAEFAANMPKIHMADYGVTIIRPLIFVAEQEIQTFAEQNSFARIMCQCPVGQNSMRRQVKNLIREIESSFPNVRENLSQASLAYGSNKALREKS
jgi:tRNA(Ile)-lysidine synthase TilS/MesJ